MTRLTQSDIIRAQEARIDGLTQSVESFLTVLMAQATRPHAEPTSDVEVTRNAKGEWQFKVSVTDRDPNAAYRKACELSEALAQRYPFGNESEPA